jgi:hypothetical protein
MMPGRLDRIDVVTAFGVVTLTWLKPCSDLGNDASRRPWPGAGSAPDDLCSRSQSDQHVRPYELHEEHDQRDHEDREPPAVQPPMCHPVTL